MISVSLVTNQSTVMLTKTDCNAPIWKFDEQAKNYEANFNML